MIFSVELPENCPPASSKAAAGEVFRVVDHQPLRKEDFRSFREMHPERHFNMAFHSKFNQLGQLEIIEIYEYYDKPLLFSCHNTAGQIFLAVLVDETENKEVWYYVPVSPQRFEQARMGIIDLHDAFSHAEDNQVYKVIAPYAQNSDVIFEYVVAAELSDNDLPLKGELLEAIEKTELSPPVEIIVLGTLIGANLRSKTFEILLIKEKDRVRKCSGRIDDDYVNGIRGVALGEDYQATVVKRLAVNYTTGKAEPKYTLVKLKNISG